MDGDAIKILLVEDNPGDARLIQEMLGEAGMEACELTCVGRLAGALSHLKQTAADVVLLDLILPDSRGLDTLRRLQEAAGATPVVVLAGLDDERVGLEAVQIGAQDYLVKGQITGDLLLRAIRYAIERHRMQQELAKTRNRKVAGSEDRYRRLLQANLDGILIVDEAGVVHFANPAAVALLGREAGDLVGEACGFPLAGEEAAEVEIPHSAGDISFAEMRTMKTVWEDRPAYLVLLRDITERKRHEAQIAGLKTLQAEMAERGELEQELRQAYARLQHIVEIIPAAIYSCRIDPGGKPEAGYTPTFVSNNITALFGYEVEACIGNPKWWPEHIHPDDAPAIFAGMLRLFEEGHLVHEYRFQARDGSWRWVHDRVVLVRDTEDNPMSIVGTWLDITERVQVEEALRESESRLDSMVACLREGICLLDGGRRVILANPVAQEYLRLLGPVSVGETVSSLGGKPMEDLLTPFADARAHEVTVEAPARRVFEIATNPVGEGGAEGGWALVIREVTQDRAVQEQVRQQDRLAAVGQLAAGIAHDFNNMLTVMMGTAQIMDMRRDVPDTLKDELRTIYVQGQRAAQLVRQVLDFSRQTVAERRPVDLTPFLKETVKLMERTLPESIKIVAEFAAGEHLVNANLTQLQQVFTNLAINARDAMPEGGELRIGLSHLRLAPGEQPPVPEEMAPGDWVVWTVSDTGAGMPSEVTVRIFEPFFTTKRRGEGTGLGLAQVHGIVKQHDGFIEVESEEGEGTTFTIYLPQIMEEEGPVEQASADDLARGAGRTILVVEDQIEVLNVARRILEVLDYGVVSASNGREALEVYDRRREEIALVLTDMVMPEMGGAALAEALRKRDPEVRIVVMTGYAGEKKEMDLPSDNVVGYLDKPLDMEQVGRVVGEALKPEGPGEG